MPVRLFTDAERERLNRFPRDISPADLLAFFTLSDDELELIGDRRGDHNRLGFVMWTLRGRALKSTVGV